MSELALLATMGAALVIGGLIGSVGIGGVLLAPWLVQVVGLGVRDAIAISMASFVATGLVALVLFARTGGDLVRDRRELIIATMPGAFLGALALAVTPERLGLLVLAGFLIVTGLRVLFGRNAPVRVSHEAGRLSEWLVGAAAGFASALTGTGGPMVLVPILVWRGTPLLTAIALGQIVQLPVAIVATVGNAVSGGVDLATGALVGAMLAPGVLLGRRVAEAMPLVIVARAVAVLLIGTGAWLALRAIL
jgi:uncharacterized membrane protein YfcA